MSNKAAASADPSFLRNSLASFIQIAALVLLFTWCFQIVAPFVHLIAWAAIIAIAVYPVYLRLASRLGGRQKLSATLLVLLGLALLLVPVWIVTDSTIDAARAVASDLEDGAVSVPPPADNVADWPVIGNQVYQVWSGASENLEATLNQFQPQLRSGGRWLLRKIGSTAGDVLQFVAAIIIAGVFMVSAETAYRASIAFTTALLGRDGTALTNLSVTTVRSVAKGILGVALTQALLSLIGLVVMGVPAAGIWTGMVLALAVVQLPPLIVLGPIAVWVFSVADPIPATLFAVYALIVSASDAFLKPLFLGRGVEIPMLVILLGAIGGAIYAGIIGLFVGAVVLALGYELLRAWMGTPNPGVESEPEAESPS